MKTYKLLEVRFLRDTRAPSKTPTMEPRDRIRAEHAPDLRMETDTLIGLVVRWTERRKYGQVRYTVPLSAISSWEELVEVREEPKEEPKDAPAPTRPKNVSRARPARRRGGSKKG